MMDRNTKPGHLLDAANDDQILEKLESLEQKIMVLREYKVKSSQLQNEQRKLLQNLNIHYNNMKRRKTRSKEVFDGKLINEHDMKKTLSKISHTSSESCFSLQTPKSFDELVNNLNVWQIGLNNRKSKIELLKSKRRSVTLPEHITNYDKRIKQLEIEKDMLNERILQFALHNINRANQEESQIVTRLENEKKKIDERLQLSQKTISYLKQTNKALNLENQILRGMNENKIFHENELDEKYRYSSRSRTSVQLPETHYSASLSTNESPSMEVIMEMEKEDDMLSLDQRSKDSFALDRQMATWPMDEENIQRNVDKLGRELKDMEVIQMKLNLIKRYVLKHGTRYINRNTLIDPSLGTGLWR